MKIILGANLSANGRVLLEEKPEHHIPESATIDLITHAISAGNLVVGRKTFEMMESFPGGLQGMLPGCQLVIISRDNRDSDSVKTVGSALEAMAFLKANGYETIAVGGGTQIYNLFLDAELATDLYLNIIPVIVGDGGVLGTREMLLTRFENIETKNLGEGVIQLHLQRVRA